MAVYPLAGESPDLSGNLIPELYALEFNIEFYAKTVFGEIANTNYEGKIKQFGDTVNIPTYGEMAVREYTKGQKLIYTPSQPGTIQLLINKGFYYAFPANQLDLKQSQIDFVPPWIKRGTNNLKIQVDQEVLSYVYGQAHAANQGATAGLESENINLGAATAPLQLTKTNILEVICQCGQVLDEQQVDDEGRWMVLPAWAITLIKTSDIKNTGLTGDDTSPIRNGRIGEVDRFQIYRSSNLTTGTDTVKVWNACFGHPDGVTFAAQLDTSEQFTDPNDFGQLVRALFVYGRLVNKPEAIGHLYLRQ